MTLLIVLPTYNERLNLEAVVQGVLAHSFTRLLVVDDESPDGTGALADELAALWPGRIDVMHRRGPRGLGLAYVDGLTKALATDVDAIGQMDADLSHDPAYIPALIEALADHDLVIGVRHAVDNPVVAGADAEESSGVLTPEELRIVGPGIQC